MHSSIVRLSIKNFMSIQDVEFSPGKVTQVVGKNSQGKTTILKAIETIFKGATDGSLVRHGAEQAELIIELPDETKIRRTIKADTGKNTLTVTRGDFKAPSPQTYLEALIDYRAFNPLTLLDPKNRTEAILQAIEIKVTPQALADYLGVKAEDLPQVDFNQHGLKVLEQVHTYYYSRRAEANKDALNKKNEFEVRQKDFVAVAPPEFSRAMLSNEQSKIFSDIKQAEAELQLCQTLIDQNLQTVGRVEKLKTHLAGVKTEKDKTLSNMQEEIYRLERQAEELRVKYQATSDAYNARLDDGQKMITDAETEIKPNPDIGPFRERLVWLKNDLETINTKDAQLVAFENNQAVAAMIGDLAAKFNEAQKVAESFNDIIGNCRNIKEEMMQDAEMPVEGLEYRDGEFYVNGTAVDNLSQSLTMRLAVGVARKVAKRTKIVCIDGVEALDDETRQQFLAEIMSDTDPFTYVYSKVGDADAGVPAIKMENGAIAK